VWTKLLREAERDVGVCRLLAETMPDLRPFLEVHRYDSQERLIVELGEKVIGPAELKVLDLR
jgi:hypothetical protein